MNSGHCEERSDEPISRITTLGIASPDSRQGRDETIFRSKYE